jgi:hypothetical protein
VTAIAAPADLDLAVALAERADRVQPWYGIGRRAPGPLALVVVRGRTAFDSIARGRLPSWGAGLAVPGARLVAIRADGDDPFRVLRHELAHLVLHDVVRGRVPLWFDEGYAAVAAAELGRLDELRLNLTVARGQVPNLEELDAGLRGAASTAELSYALAASAVAFLARKNPTGGLEPLLAELGKGAPFDTAVAVTTGFTPGRFEDAWRKDIRRRYGLGLWLAAGGMWSLIGGAVVFAAVWRRRRDRPRRAALDVGWVIEPEEPPPAPAPVERGSEL